MLGQKRILVLSLGSALMFLHTRSKLTANLAHIGDGAFRARDALYDIPPSLCGKEVLHVLQFFSERFRWLVGDVEVVVP